MGILDRPIGSPPKIFPIKALFMNCSSASTLVVFSSIPSMRIRTNEEKKKHRYGKRGRRVGKEKRVDRFVDIPEEFRKIRGKKVNSQRLRLRRGKTKRVRNV